MHSAAARIPILTYHARNVFGHTYASNDHVALASDLVTLTQHGWRVESLSTAVDAFLAGDIPEKTLCLTFDDGTDYDVRELIDPEHGPQPGFLPILKRFQAQFPGAQPALHATSFVIASPDARHAMDTHCVHGQGWMGEAWWPEAVATGLIGIGNHSWDHNHEVVPVVAQRNQEKGNFHCIDTFEDAEAQIRRAHAYIGARASNAALDLFCYPFGHVAPYLRDVYLPQQAASAVPFVRAAFGTEADFLNANSNRWNLPRLVCGWHWKSPSELEQWLSKAESASKGVQ
jgi:peptidoglycan/xylan/chitin deacetylase (PgdA/CDA1 family)